MQGGRVFIFHFTRVLICSQGPSIGGKLFIFFRDCLACLLGLWGLTHLLLLLSLMCIHSANPVPILSSVPGSSGEPDVIPACDELLSGDGSKPVGRLYSPHWTQMWK